MTPEPMTAAVPCRTSSVDALMRMDRSVAALRKRAVTVSREAERYVRTGQFERVLQPIDGASRPRSTEPHHGSVLIVDDDIGYAHRIARLLSAALATRVEVATGVPEAAATMATQRFAAIVIDVDLGDGLGMEVAARARELYGDGVGIVVISGVVAPQLAEIAERLRADGSLEKTEDPCVLIETCRRLTACADDSIADGQLHQEVRSFA